MTSFLFIMAPFYKVLPKTIFHICIYCTTASLHSIFTLYLFLYLFYLISILYFLDIFICIYSVSVIALAAMTTEFPLGSIKFVSIYLSYARC